MNIRARIDDTVDQRGKAAKRVGLFLAVTVSIIDALDTGNGMTHYALGNIRADHGTRHE